MPHAWAAMHVLAQLMSEAGVDGFGPTFLSDRPAPVAHLAAKNQWNDIKDAVKSGTKHSLIQVSGGPHVGKTTFLSLAAMTWALDGPYQVLNLLHPSSTVLTELTTYVSEWLSWHQAPAALFLRAELWETLQPLVASSASGPHLVVIELPGDSLEWRVTPDEWNGFHWAFPPFSSREWYRWISAAI
jgi:hypothetical protein